MNQPGNARSRRNLLLGLAFLSAIAAIIVLPFSFGAEAGRKSDGKGLFTKPSSRDDDLPNYDIRADKSAFEKLAAYRGSLNRSASQVADERDELVRGEDKLKAKVPTLKIEYSPEIRTPEVITPDPGLGRAFLSRPTQEKRSVALKGFLTENKGLIGATDGQIDELKLFAEYKNPDGNLSFVEYSQDVNGIPVFRGSVKAAFTHEGEIIRVINNFAPGLDYAALSADFGSPDAALTAAARYINHDLKANESSLDAERSDGLKTYFGQGDWAPTAEKIYFPTEPGIAVPAWRVLIWQPVSSYYVIVDAASGEMLWRKNITEDQTQSSSFEVYTNPNAMINVADSPAPLAPTVFNPNFGTQGSPIARTSISRIGNEAPYSFNNNGWINDATNLTDGNNVESGLDITAPDGIDGGSQATGIPYRVFSSAWNPPPGGSDSPDMPEARRGAVIQQFYIMNWYHDELYRLGFTEAARNFQNSNFGRGGVGNDRVSAEGQDSASTNNANFSTPADGGRGRMQMFVFTGPSPDRDGTGDAEIIIHEATHGTSNRLHGNADGLVDNMARAMGEGWSDFYAHSLLSEPGDPLNGTYPLTGYLMQNGFGAVGNANYYYGIRRFPKSIMSSTGGPQNRPFNPLTFADIDQTKLNTSDGAFPAMFGAHISLDADQAHAAGEIWSSALWEVRAKFIQRLGWANGNRRVLQLVTDAMKVSPLNPTFLQARDAIISVAFGSATTQAQREDASDVWAGFAIRGMGVNASIQNTGGFSGGGTTRVTESFDRPNLLQLPKFTVSDAQGDNDGIYEPGETLSISVTLTNVTGQTANSVNAVIPGAGSAAYGTIGESAAVSKSFTYVVPPNSCGNLINLSMNVTSSLGAKTFPLPLPIGLKSTTLSQNFDSVGAPNLPSGWTTAVESGGIAFVTSSATADSPPNSAFVPNANVTSSSSLVSPAIQVNSQVATVSFRHRYHVETPFDGGVLEISYNGGFFQDIITAGGSFIEGGYDGTLSFGNGSNPLSGRQAWFGNRSSFLTTTVQLPLAANGQSIQLRWRLGTDSNTGSDSGYTGWYIDNVIVRATSTCSFVPNTVRSRADFDGDGKTDMSVFRPSNGTWYLARSQAGITAMTWGVSTDTPVPGDYDGDGKSDLAVFRPASGSVPDFYIVKSNGFVFQSVSWGEPGDKSVTGDYDGDGKDDIAVYRSSDNMWYVVKSSGGTEFTQFGQAGDVPVPGKFDADNKTDRAVYRNGLWIVSKSTGGTTTVNWGLATDVLVPADYDGDDRDDFAVWRPSNATWYIRQSSNDNFVSIPWGQTGDVPAPGDFDGDGRDDPAVYRNGLWYLRRSTAGQAVGTWGVSTDIPIPAKYLP
ncbi:MAG: M36 family metallopeptidase [Acidobacteria bacterium]|nr:M36 family metallopeptidase [Acidobacteriota bacterium]